MLLGSQHIVAAPWALVMDNLERSLNNDLSLLAGQSGYGLDKNFSHFDFSGSIAATVSLRTVSKENETVMFALKNFINTVSFFYKLVPSGNASLREVIEGKCSIFFLVESGRSNRPGEDELIYEAHNCTSNEIFAKHRDSILGITKNSNIDPRAVTIGKVSLYWDASQIAKSTKSRKKLETERQENERKRFLEILEKLLLQ